MNIEEKIELNKNLIWGVINDLEFIPANVYKEDLEQIGGIALWRAIEDYNEEENKCSFGTFAYKRIKRDILDYCRKSMAKKRQGIINEGLYDDGIEDMIINKMLIDEVYKWVDERSADLLIDKHCNNYTFKELENKYELTTKQVRTKLEKVIKILRKNMKWED